MLSFAAEYMCGARAMMVVPKPVASIEKYPAYTYMMYMFFFIVVNKSGKTIPEKEPIPTECIDVFEKRRDLSLVW